MVKFRQFFLGGTAGFLLALSFLGVAATVSYFGAGSADQLGVSLATLLAGEDQTNNVMRTEQQFSFAIDDADLVVKNSPGFLHSVWCYPEDGAATAGTVRITNTTAAGGAETTEVWGADFAAAAMTPVGAVL